MRGLPDGRVIVGGSGEHLLKRAVHAFLISLLQRIRLAVRRRQAERLRKIGKVLFGQRCRCAYDLL